MANAPTTEDAKAMDLIQASGVLNPNVTLDKLMNVTRQLGEGEPAPSAGPIETASMTFVGWFYVYKQVQR